VNIANLEKLIRKLKRKLNKYKDIYSQNEVAVREQIVSPLLRALGWDPEDPQLVIPEYTITIIEKGKERKIKLDYALMRHGTLFSAMEVKALGKVTEEVLGRALKVAQTTGVQYIIVTDGDLWRLYNASKPITEALICEWSVLGEKSKDVASKVLVIANTKWFGNPEARILIEAQPKEKPQKCPHCGYKGDFKLLQTWRYSLWNVYYYECPKCSGKFRFYVDPKGEKKSYVIPIIRRGKE
jgi:DNA-directed RNA polymerase subunit M/transcription elongation factor TFIIS